ncbi:Protein IL-40 [Vulpes lagopus]
MRLLLLLCLALLATCSFSLEQEVGYLPALLPQVRDLEQKLYQKVTPETFIAYKVREVFPSSRRVVITCHSPRAPPPITYSLWGSQGVEVAKKVVKTGDPASGLLQHQHHPQVQARTSHLLLPGSLPPGRALCQHQAADVLGVVGQPMAQPRANFVLLERGSGPRVEISCQVSSGSPPITYSLVRKDGHVHRQQTPTYGQPANFSFPLTRTSNWLRCQAENDISVQSSPFRLVPPGHLPQGPVLVLAGSLTSIAAVTSWVLGPALWTRVVSRKGRRGEVPSGGSGLCYRRTHHWNEGKACQL